MKPVSIFDDLTIDCKIEKDSLEDLHRIFDIPIDITEKMVDIYNHMAVNKIGKLVLQFETGIKMVCEIDASEWKNPPRIDLDDVLKGGIK